MLSNKINKSIVLGALLASTATHAQDSDLQGQIDALKQEIKALKSQSNTNKELINSSMNSGDDKKVSFHGFMSVGFSQLSESDATVSYANGQDADLSVKPNTWVGLQMNAQLYQGGEFVFQVVSKGEDDFEPEAEWLYLKQDLGAGFNTQIGRIRFPAFIDSEVIYIGNTYAQVKPSTEVYSILPINHLDGVSINHSTDIGNWTLDSKVVVWGEADRGTEGYTLSLEEVHGAVFSATHDYLTMRFGAFSGKEIVKVDTAFGDERFPYGLRNEFGDELVYTTMAVRYDNAQVYLSAEGISIRSDQDLLDENENWTVTAGWYFGSLLAYVGASETKVTNQENMINAITDELGQLNPVAVVPVTGFGPGIDTSQDFYNSLYPAVGDVFTKFLNRQQDTLTAGIKWDFSTRSTFKLQVQRVSGFDNTLGNFNDFSDDSFDRMYIYDIAIQTTF